MKRILSLLLSLLLLLLLSFVGCQTDPRPSGEAERGLFSDTETRIETRLSSESQAPVETRPQPSASEAETPKPAGPTVSEDGVYDSKDEVALYIHLFGHLPSNYITKKQAESLGWSGGSLEPYAPGKCIGGSHFGNYEGRLPDAPGRSWTECDIGTKGASSRGAKRIVFSNDGLIYYTADHYESFELLYGQGA